MPSASHEALRLRAATCSKIRAFFSARGVLEVDTPILSAAATVDRHIESFASHGRWLQTSPEFAMKRLLAAGSGCIWQLCKVFRLEESGRHHNPEFTLIEWYRLGLDHHALIAEMAELFAALGVVSAPADCPRISYQEAFLKHAGIDPLSADAATLQALLTQRGRPLPMMLSAEAARDRDFWLDLVMTDLVAPALGLQAPCFLFDYPASQAALARVRGPVASRFEVFWRGVELANGYHELTDAEEQERRFIAEQSARRAAQASVPPYDHHLVAALRHGMPECAGVAMGFDRLLMLMQGAERIDQVMSFSWERA